MKNFFCVVFRRFFVIMLPVTFACFILASVVLVPWALGLAPWHPGVVGWLTVACLSTPMAIGLCLARPVFNPRLGQLPILSTYSLSVLRGVRVMNFISHTIYAIQLWLVRSYEGHYNGVFRVTYALMNAGLLGLALSHLRFAYDERAIAMTQTFAMAVFLVTVTMSVIHMTISKTVSAKKR